MAVYRQASQDGDKHKDQDKIIQVANKKLNQA